MPKRNPKLSDFPLPEYYVGHEQMQRQIEELSGAIESWWNAGYRSISARLCDIQQQLQRHIGAVERIEKKLAEYNIHPDKYLAVIMEHARRSEEDCEKIGDALYKMYLADTKLKIKAPYITHMIKPVFNDQGTLEDVTLDLERFQEQI